MVKKIISGGQTGAERAAYDLALRFHIPHEGWIPKDCIAEYGPSSIIHQPSQIPIDNYGDCIENNVLDSDGSLIITDGLPYCGSVLALDLVCKNNRPYLHIDLKEISTLEAVFFVRDWVFENKVEILNVTGAQESEDPGIYQATFDILKNVLLTDAINERVQGSIKKGKTPNDNPVSVNQAINIMMTQMAFKYQVAIANSSEDELNSYHSAIGFYIGHRLMNSRNEKLLESCRQVAKDNYLHWDEVPMVIMKELWRRLRQTHRLRVVK